MSAEGVLALLGGLLAGVLAFRAAGRVLEAVLKVVGRSLFGAAALYGLQAVFPGRFHVGVNPLTVLAVGLLGLPGLTALLLYGFLG